MPDEKAIKAILLEMKIYSWALALAGSEAELFRLFRDGFQTLVKLCQR